MKTWILAGSPSNVVVVGGAYACSFLLFNGDASTYEVTSMQDPAAEVRSACAPFTISAELERAVRFQSLAASWRAERGAVSSIHEMCATPAYLSIMAMGPEVIPLLIGQLKSEGSDPDHWFVALHYISKGIDPVPEEDRGDMIRMSLAWQEWAEREMSIG